MKKLINSNPLMQEAEPEEITAQAEPEEEATVVTTFKIREPLLKKFRNYCYTERLEFKEGLDLMLSEFLDKIDDGELLEYREKPKKKRRRS